MYVNKCDFIFNVEKANININKWHLNLLRELNLSKFHSCLFNLNTACNSVHMTVTLTLAGNKITGGDYKFILMGITWCLYLVSMRKGHILTRTNRVTGLLLL